MHSSSVFTYESGLLLRNEGIVSINIRELSSSENPLLLYWDAKVKIYAFNVMHVCKCKASHLQKSSPQQAVIGYQPQLKYTGLNVCS